MAYNLDNYVTVAERLTQAAGQIQTIVTEPPAFLTDTMGYIRVSVALKDGRSATGIASFRLDLQGRSAQATNPIEDCETSAIGRALGFLGYGSSKSIASREEVQEAERRASTPAQRPAPPLRQQSAPAPNGKRPANRNGIIKRIEDLEGMLVNYGFDHERESFDAYTDEQLIEMGKRLKAAFDKAEADAIEAEAPGVVGERALPL